MNSVNNLNKYIDHTVLKPDVKLSDIDKLISEAIDFSFISVCINPCFVKYAKDKLLKTDVKVCTVIGFPLGQNTIETKVFETKNAIQNGADEIDMVVNISMVKSGDFDYVYREIKSIREVSIGKVLKVIFETCLLTDDEIIKLSEICTLANVDFVKTSTGFSNSGADINSILLMKRNVGKNVGIKASGGIRSIEDATLMINNGATRIGASASLSIMEGNV